MNQVLFLLFCALALLQPNAQTAEASGFITAAQFLTLGGTILTTKRKPNK